jgi:Uma2 family endonuclease
MATKALMTLEEFDALPNDGLKHELNKGELVTKTFAILGHNRVVRRIYDILSEFLRNHPLGELICSDTGFVLSGPGEPAAELTIEVVSPSDTGPELLERTTQYLAAGGRQVWLVYPEERKVWVFEASRRHPCSQGRRHPGSSGTAARLFHSHCSLLRIICQCRKWRTPVNTIARLRRSAAAITSASLTDPPG